MKFWADLGQKNTMKKVFYEDGLASICKVALWIIYLFI